MTPLTADQSRLAASAVTLLGRTNRGVMGLLRAAQGFRPGKASFKSYANRCVRNAAKDEDRAAWRQRSTYPPGVRKRRPMEPLIDTRAPERDPDVGLTLNELSELHPDAMEYLNDLYLNHHGVQRDYARALGVHEVKVGVAKAEKVRAVRARN